MPNVNFGFQIARHAEREPAELEQPILHALYEFQFVGVRCCVNEQWMARFRLECVPQPVIRAWVRATPDELSGAVDLLVARGWVELTMGSVALPFARGETGTADGCRLLRIEKPQGGVVDVAYEKRVDGVEVVHAVGGDRQSRCTDPAPLLLTVGKRCDMRHLALTRLGLEHVDMIRGNAASDEGKGCVQTKRGMSVDEVQGKAESYVKHHGFPGVNALAVHCGCHHTTLRKAIERSERLKKAKGAHDLFKAKAGTRRVGNDPTDPAWQAVVDEALSRLTEYAPESRRAELNTPDMRKELGMMEPDALAKLVDDAREQYEKRQRAARPRTGGRACARAGE